MLSRFIAKVESMKASLGQWAAGFFGIIFIRFFLQNISSPTPSFPAVPDTITLVHYALFYFAALLLTALIIRIFVPDIANISKFLVFIFPISWLPPIVDLLASHGSGSLMSYVFSPRSALLQSFFTLGGSYSLGGITLGIKVELAIIVIGVLSYAFAKTKNIWKAIGAAICSYFGIFFLVALPSFLAINAASPYSALISAFANSHVMNNFARATNQYSYLYAVETVFNLGFANIFYLFCFALIVVWICLYRPRMLKTFFSNIRPGRIIHFIVMLILGAIVGAITSKSFVFGGPLDVVVIVNIVIAFVCAWLFAVGVNDLEDVEIDKISNSGRPLVAGDLSAGEIRSTNAFFLVWSLFGGYLAGYWAFFAIITFTCAYYIYSAHPLRLKQIPFLATFLISLACLSAAITGFYFTSTNKFVSAFPPQFLWLILIFFTLMLNVKDVKDIAGDRAEGITTVPVAFPRYGKEVVGGLFAAAFLSVPIILGANILYIPSLITAVIGYILINAKRYREWTVFVVYFAYIAAAGLLLWPV